MRKTTFWVMLIILTSRITGFGREMLLSYFYGASNVSDAYIISRTIPFLLFEFIGIGIVTGYMPVVSEIKSRSGELDVLKFTNNLLNIVLTGAGLIVVLVCCFTEAFVKLFASGFAADTLALTVRFTRIGVASICFISIIYVMRGFLQYKRNFTAPELIGLPLNFVIISGIYVSSWAGLDYLAIAGVLATFTQIIFLIPFLKKKKFKYSFLFNLKDKYIKKMFFLSLPVMLGVSVNQINMLVDRTIASRIYEGGISALNYANRVNIVVQSIFVLSVTSVIFPVISDMAAKKDIRGIKNKIAEAANMINILITPVTVGVLVFSKEIIETLFGRGAFDEKAMIMTSASLFFYSFGMIGFGLREIVSKAFFSLQDTKTPMINAAIGLIVNIVLNIILAHYMGIKGLALATSFSAVFTSVLLLISLRKRIGDLGIHQICKTFLKIIGASALMGVVAKLSYVYFTGSFLHDLSFFIAGSIGAIFYIFLIYLMKVEGMEELFYSIKKRFLKEKL